MNKLIRIEPFELPDSISSEIYFSKFFPINQLIEKGYMKRTAYGITLTKKIQKNIIQQMEELQLNQDLTSRFKEKKYLEIELEELWKPIVCAVAKINKCESTVRKDGVYVSLSLADVVQKEASAVYEWFRHVKNVLKKINEKDLKIMGDYV